MSKDPYALSTYHYDLPEELIAQYPLKNRDESRLMIVERSTGHLSEISFRELPGFLSEQDMLIFNDTKVFRSRLLGNRKSGGKAEIFLTLQRGDGTWEALAKPGKKLPVGSRVNFSPELFCEVVECLPEGGRVVRFHFDGDFDEILERHAQIPLPLYIKREEEKEIDAERYQTVYAAHKGSVAAPTAGLHFTSELLEQLKIKGVSLNTVTLHVGLGTFLPVKSEDIRQHAMHGESFFITPETASAINERPKNKKLICVGTTTCRALESAASDDGLIHSGSYKTNIFIYPGYRFKCVDNLLTNFHLPGSTLLMLTSALAGYDLMMEAYKKAVKERFRFFSYGDAMLII